MRRGSEKIATMARVTTTKTETVTETDTAMEMAIAGSDDDEDGHRWQRWRQPQLVVTATA